MSSAPKSPMPKPTEPAGFSLSYSDEIPDLFDSSDPIIDILKDDFKFEEDHLVLFSVTKCPGGCPDC